VNNFQDLQSGQDERATLLREVFSAALSTAHGVQQHQEQQISQMMSGLVRAKLLTADDSYKLQDQILDKSLFERSIETRIEESLRNKGILTQRTIDELNTRLTRLGA